MIKCVIFYSFYVYTNLFLQLDKLLEAKNKFLYWTPWLAHYVDLMLEDIRSIPQVKKTLERVIIVIDSIYKHHDALNMMEKITKKKSWWSIKLLNLQQVFLFYKKYTSKNITLETCSY